MISTQQSEIPLLSKKMLKKELLSLFCVFPVDPENKVRMLQLEIARIHMITRDYRNAFKMVKALESGGGNGNVLSKCALFCLEMGKHNYARELFKKADPSISDS